MFDWPDVCSLDFRSATTVDQPQSCDGATFAIGSEHVFSEVPVAHRPACQLIDPLPCRRDLERCLILIEAISNTGLIDPRKDVGVGSKTTFNNPGKVRW